MNEQQQDSGDLIAPGGQGFAASRGEAVGDGHSAPTQPEPPLPCPFCGEEPRIVKQWDESLWSHAAVEWMHIVCDECQAESVSSEVHEDVIAAWNRRPIPCDGHGAPTGRSGWQPIDTAPKDRRFLAVVDEIVRVVRWGKTSHVPLSGFCLADQGAEDFDLCRPTQWMAFPEPPGSGSSPMDAAPATGRHLTSEAAKPLASNGADQPASESLPADISILLQQAAQALESLLDDTQHKHHPDCEDGPCPVREARKAAAALRQRIGREA